MPKFIYNAQRELRHDKDMVLKLKRGDFVSALKEKLEGSLEAKASDTRFSPYLFKSKGEVLEVRDDYVLVKFGQVPTPNIWLRIDQLEKFK